MLFMVLPGKIKMVKDGPTNKSFLTTLSLSWSIQLMGNILSAHSSPVGLLPLLLQLSLGQAAALDQCVKLGLGGGLGFLGDGRRAARRRSRSQF